MNPSNIIISTHAHKIGDVLFSLPVAALLKKRFPEIIIGFIGTDYTKAIIEACPNIDVFIDKQPFLENTLTLKNQSPECLLHIIPNKEIAQRAKQLKIPLRIGTNRRIYHWLTCNRFITLSRKNSSLHEIQLNIKMLKAFNMNTEVSLTEISDLYALPPLDNLFTQTDLLQADKFKLIIHPKSGGSAKEWDIKHYIDLIQSLDTNKFQIFISGTQKERLELQSLFNQVGDKVTDICGRLTLSEFIGLISLCDGLIACSTGPLHLAAALNKHALGIYAPRSPIFAQRWGPVGKKARVFALDNKDCNSCRKNNAPCACMQAIKPMQLKDALEHIYNHEFSNTN